MHRNVFYFCLICGLCAAGTRIGLAQSAAAGRDKPRGSSAQQPDRTAVPSRNQTPRLVQAPQSNTPQQPPGFPLSPERQKRVDDILTFWEKQTAEIKTFQCEYVREEYDPVMGPRNAPEKIIQGIIKYAAPDKGLMEDREVKGYVPPEKKGDAEYRPLPDAFGQYWLCDGLSVFLKDFRKKVLTETKLPLELRGKAIAEGPLPFVFGAKAEAMKKRFWIREVTPDNNPGGEYFLEVLPKEREDAANYEKIVVILDRKTNQQLLPRAMRVTIRRHSVQRGEKAYYVDRYDDYHFAVESRRVNDPRDRVKGFFQAFVQPDVPADWKREVRDWNMNPIHTPVASQKRNGPAQARRQIPETRRR
jgi:TIGR03009 family protein